MANLTPEEIAAKYAARTSAATGDWVRGVQGVTQSPGAAAAAKADKWAANTAAAKDKFQRRAAGTSLSDWQNAAIEKQSRYAQGTQAGASKMAEFQREFQPFQKSVTAKVRAMPDTTIEQRLDRARAQAMETHKFQRRG